MRRDEIYQQLAAHGGSRESIVRRAMESGVPIHEIESMLDKIELCEKVKTNPVVVTSPTPTNLRTSTSQ